MYDVPSHLQRFGNLCKRLNNPLTTWLLNSLTILKFWIGIALIAVSFGLAFLGAMGAEATEHNYRRSRGVVAVLTGFVTD